MKRLSDLDLKLLRIFKSVVEDGGLSAAEASLNMSVSNISTRLSDLENRIGARLCERGRHGFALTEQGKQIYRATQDLMLSLEDFASRVQTTVAHIKGELRLILTDNTLSDPKFPIVQIMQRFRARAPQVYIRLSQGSRSEVETAVINGNAQLGITSMTNSLGNLECHPLYAEDLFLYCGKQHPLFAKKAEEITLADIEQCCFLDTASGSHCVDPISGSVKTATAASLEARALLILTGSHVSFLPSHYSQRWTGAGQMRALLPDTMYFKKDMYALTKKGRSSNPALDLFIEELLYTFPRARLEN